MGIIIYPSKFTSLSSEPGTIISKGDVSVKMLYGIYTARTNGSHSWKYQSMVLQSAHRLFGNFIDWVARHQEDRNIAGYNAKFLAETLNFIQQDTPRSMSAIVWKDVMENYNSSYYSVSVDANMKANRYHTKSEETSRILTKWVTKRNGFDDLVTTLYVLFGSK